MTDQSLDSVIKLLRSVGAKGCLDEDDRFAFKRKDEINRKSSVFWESIAEKLSKQDLENLFRGLVIVERELNWIGGSVAGAIWVFQEYKRRFEGNTSIELANWALKNRGRNPYIPFGGLTHASNYHEWIDEKELKAERYGEHIREQQLQRKEKIIRQEKRVESHEERLQYSEVRAILVKEYNRKLSLAALGERLNLIARSDMPLESVDSKLLNEILVEFPTLDTATKKVLLKKIDRCDRGSWGKIKRILSI
jgi:hypothetical protein